MSNEVLGLWVQVDFVDNSFDKDSGSVCLPTAFFLTLPMINFFERETWLKQIIEAECCNHPVF
jgi:hypothetical protein